MSRGRVYISFPDLSEIHISADPDGGYRADGSVGAGEPIQMACGVEHLSQFAPLPFRRWSFRDFRDYDGNQSAWSAGKQLCAACGAVATVEDPDLNQPSAPPSHGH